MAEQAFNPNPASAVDLPAVYYGEGAFSGSGDPNGQAIGWPGARYLDTATGDRYSKTSGEGTMTGWELDPTGGGGGSQEVYRGSGDPNGNQEATGAAWYYDTTNGIFYFHNAAGTSDTNWINVLQIPS